MCKKSITTDSDLEKLVDLSEKCADGLADLGKNYDEKLGIENY